MKRREARHRSYRIGTYVTLVALLGGALSGCGSPAGAHPAVHQSAAKEIERQVAKSMSTWETTSAKVIDVVHLKGHAARTLDLALDTASSPTRYAVTINQRGQKTVTIVDDGRNTTSYTQGSRHYQVLSSLPFSPDAVRLMGLTLPSLVSSSTLISASTLNRSEVELKMMTPLPSGITARTELWYNLNLGVPIRMSAHWQGGEFSQTVTNFQVNPNLGASTFTFHPENGVTPEVVLSQTLTDLQLAKAAVKFPIVLPPSLADVTLSNVSVGSANGQTVVILTYIAPNGSYLLVTERSAAAKQKVPSGVSVTTEPFGNLSTQEGALPLSGEFAAFSVQSTEIWLEGLASSVDNLLTVWGNNVSAGGPGT